MKKSCSLLFVIFLFIGAAAQIKSPDQFLDYPLGSHFTPHYQVVNYFKYIADAVPNQVKLKQYGTTNEGRPLLTAFISNAVNISNLEKIRENNLSLARQYAGTGTTETPVIVWLSYNIHGNEAASTEAAMKTLYSLVDPSDADSKKWLQNTVVVIDPCMNPDGRDRYVNWYNSIAGNQVDVQSWARIHREPWPGGRTNHYNYDLNRDWVWQTQKESKARVATYNQWLPQVHVDFHEQGFNSPYYFAPGAQPYHEVITQWQRDFQKTIGKNNARHFDEHGWYFFTGEEFDLLYPSYGDTYPLYNGAIGMTYEQGGIGAGLGVKTNDGDTLTLTDRLMHHYTTGRSTIEIASENASNLLQQYKAYFDDALAGKIGTYKTYVIKNTAGSAQQIESLRKLLDQNGIKYGTSSGSFSGFNYATKKDESFSVSEGDLVVSAQQARAVLVKVLFEPETMLVDSVTYDITAWSLPYAFGLTAYATRQALKVNDYVAPATAFPALATSYGYAIKWEGMQSARALGKLLQKGIRVSYSEVPFKANDEEFGRGTLVITHNGNKQFGEGLWKEVSSIATAYNLKMYPVKSGMVEKGSDLGSHKVHIIKPVNIVLFTGEGVSSSSAGELWDYFDNQLDYPAVLANATDFGRINLDKTDILVMPSGQFRFLSDVRDAARLESWIRGGGKVIAFGSAVSQLAKQKWSVMKLKKDSVEKKEKSEEELYSLLKTYDNRERDEIPAFIPGAIYKVEVDNTHPLMFGYPDYYYTLKLSADVYNFIEKGGWNVGYLKKDNYMAGFVGSKVFPKLKDGLVFGVQDLSRGNIVYLTDDIIFRNFWETGKLVLANAVFMVGM